MYLSFPAVTRRISPRKKILHSGRHARKGFQPLFSFKQKLNRKLKHAESLNVRDVHENSS